MSTLDKINELNNRRNEIEKGGASGNNPARERIANLLDTSSFVEMGAFITHRSTNYNLPEK